MLHFVVHKHAASHLHYDFRLEFRGVLKSWAIPKGPSLNPKDKRLAIMVDDHPYSCKDFEGVIPEGEYGAGVIMIWDAGSYCPLHGDEKAFSKDLLKGKITFTLSGSKLKGVFSLVKLKNSDKNEWLLIKGSDEYASTRDILKDDRSVVSGRTLEEIRQSAS